MKFRSFFSGLAIVVLVLLLLAAGGFYWVTAQNPLRLLKGGQNTTPSAAIFVPRQAPAMVSLLVNPAQLEAFRLVAAPPSERRQASTELNQFKQSLLGASGLSYKEDIQPWLGQELTLAVTTLDIDRDAENGRQPGYLLAISTKDTQRSREFLQLFWQKRAIAGADLTFEQYKGVKLIYASPLPSVTTPTVSRQGFYQTQPQKRRQQAASTAVSPTTTALASAVVGDRFVLFANDPKVLRDAINNVQASDLNLSSATFYDQSLQALSQPRIGLAFINLPKLGGWLAEEVVGQPEPGKEQSSQADGSPGGGYQTLAIGLGLSRQGLLAETALLGLNDTASSTLPALTQPVSALKYIPVNSPVAASGVNLNQLWSQISEESSSSETVNQLIKQPLIDLQTQWQIDLSADIVSWVTGEYALALLADEPTPATPVTNQSKKKRQQPTLTGVVQPAPTQPGWIFAAERSPEAIQAIAHLDDLAKQQGLSVGSLQLGDRTVSAWTQLKPIPNAQRSPLGLLAEVKGVHTSVNQYEVFATSIAAMDKALKAVDNSLLTDAHFKQATAPLAQPNNGYLYLDWTASKPILERQFPLLKVIELAGQLLFNHLRSLTISSYGEQAGVQRGGVFVELNQ